MWVLLCEAPTAVAVVRLTAMSGVRAKLDQAAAVANEVAYRVNPPIISVCVCQAL